MRRRPLAASSPVVAALILLAGCGQGSSSVSAGTICPVVAAARVRILGPNDLTFETLVRQDQRSEVNAGASAMVGLARDSAGTRLGPYEAVLDYLDVRNTAWTPEFRDEVEVPDRTDEVIESAQRLDRDLADGLCDNEPSAGG